MAKKASGGIKDVWQCRSVSTKTKRRLVETLLWSSMSYGSETWIFNKLLIKKTAAFETWRYRRILKISWEDFLTNEDVYRRAATKPRLCQLARRMRFFRHIIRKKGLGYRLINTRTHGTRPRGRPRLTWLKDICDHRKISRSQALPDREEWRVMSALKRTPAKKNIMNEAIMNEAIMNENDLSGVVFPILKGTQLYISCSMLASMIFYKNEYQ